MSVSWETSLVGLNWTWGQKLSSSLMLVPFITTQFFQFHFEDTQRYRHPSWCFNIQLLLPLHLLIHLETRESLNTRGAEGLMAATSHHSDDMMAKSSNSHGPSVSSLHSVFYHLQLTSGLHVERGSVPVHQEVCRTVEGHTENKPVQSLHTCLQFARTSTSQLDFGRCCH